MKLAAVRDQRIMLPDGMVDMQAVSALQKFRKSGNMVLLMTDFCRTETVRRFYPYANMFAADGGMFAFSGCRTLYDAPLKNEEITLLQTALAEEEYCIRREYANACGGSAVLLERGEKRDSRYLMSVFDAAERKELLEEKLGNVFTVHEDGNHLYLLRRGSYMPAAEACASGAGIAKEDVVLW